MNFSFGNVFNGMFGPVKPGMCKIGLNGEIAVKTSTGYKTYDPKRGTLVNCNDFAFEMDGAFYVVPTFKVTCGDIILVNSKPRRVIEVGEKTIKVFSYEDSSILEVVPEHHVFMGKTYCYGKIFSPFMNMGKNGDNTMASMMNMVMMNQMFNGGNNNGNNSNNMFANMMPMMFMMNGGNGMENPFMNMFSDAFNFGDAEDPNVEVGEENK